MKAFTQTVLATVVTVAALSAGAAQANPFGHGPKINYIDSFNRTNSYQTQIDNSKRVKTNTDLKYDIDNSVRNRLNNDVRFNLRHDYRQDNLNANQTLNQLRGYSSGVGQNAANVGGASGHNMSQSQGDTRVGTLVSESNSDRRSGLSLLSPSYRAHYGDTSQGNLYGSQIGANQSGAQFGDVTSVQGNDQSQDAASYVGSTDSVSNGVSK